MTKFKNIFIWNHSACENAIIERCSCSEFIDKIFYANKNSLSLTSPVYPVKSVRNEFFRELKENNIQLIIANAGINDTGFIELCRSKKFLCIGADKKSTEIEKSKIFSKQLMTKYNINTPDYCHAASMEEAEKAIEKIGFPCIIKADGFAKSLSAVRADSFENAYKTIKKYLDGYFGQASSKIIIEKYINGLEVSVPCICDGKNIKILNFVRDYKKHLENDLGSNTGSMGSYCPFLLSEKQKELINNLVLQLNKALNSESLLYKGFMTLNVIFSDNEVWLLEINTRLGDSEGQVVLELLENDISEILEAMLNQTLDSLELKFKKKYAAAVNIVTDNYPDFPDNKDISLITKSSIQKISKQINGIFFYNNVRIKDENYFQTYNRFISIVHSDKDIISCSNKIYKCIEELNAKNIFFRTDIGYYK